MFQKNYDVVVCGGGIAGVAAALAAARRGMRTALVEKTIQPGGLATGGLVLVYLPLCDGRGKQVTSGLAEELFHAANLYGPADEPSNWREVGGSRLEVHFSPASFVLAMDELLEEARVDIWLDTAVTGVITQADGTVKMVEVFNKSGSGQLAAKVFIDATGDADVAHFAGNQCLKATNALVTWVIEHREARDSSPFCFGKQVSTGILSESITSVYTSPGVDGKMVSDFVLAGRRKYRNMLLDDYRENLETRKTRYPLALPSVPPLRHCRCIKGKTILTSEPENHVFADSIGLAADWRCRGSVWEIPYSSMLPDNLSGLIAAGRCTSAIDDAWEITRVIPVAAMTGEVAGVAAALSISQDIPPHKLAYGDLAQELRKNCKFLLKLEELNET